MNILVTGGSGDIGEEVCRELDRAGHQVAIHFHHSKKRASQIASDIHGIAVQADISKKAQVDGMVKGLVKKWGSLECLINIAGFPIVKETQSYWEAPFEKITAEMFRDVFDVDTLGTIHCIQAVLPFMKKKKYGKIINFVSTPAVSGHTKGYPFTAAKGAILSLTKSVALEVASHHITMNAIAPCTIATRWFDLYPAKLKKKIVSEIPMGRLGSPKDIAPLVSYLVSPGSDWITGKVFVVDGGEVRL